MAWAVLRGVQGRRGGKRNSEADGAGSFRSVVYVGRGSSPSWGDVVRTPRKLLADEPAHTTLGVGALPNGPPTLTSGGTGRAA